MIFILDDRAERQSNLIGHKTLPSHIEAADGTFIRAFKDAQNDEGTFRRFLHQMPKNISILCVHASSLFTHSDRIAQLEKHTSKKNPPIPLIKFSGGNSLVSTERAGLVFNANVRTFYQRLLHNDNHTPHSDPLLLLFGSKFHVSELMNLRRWLSQLLVDDNSKIPAKTVRQIRNYEGSSIVQSLFESIDNDEIENKTKSEMLNLVTQKINELISS